MTGFDASRRRTGRRRAAPGRPAGRVGLGDPRTTKPKRLIFIETLRGLQNFTRYPQRKSDFVADMVTRRRVLLVHLPKPLDADATGEPHQGRPQAAMYHGQLGVDQPAKQNLG